MKIYDLRIMNDSKYLSWDKKIISDFTEEHIETMYNNGYVFTRVGKGVMNQTRSLRIDLSKFELSSENRRVLKKTEDLTLSVSPISYADYTWEIHKMGKEFYAKKFGEKTFSAQKIKELITDNYKSNFNRLFVYTTPTPPTPSRAEGDNILLLPRGGEGGVAEVGYCIALETKNILHYCYPFYQLQTTNNALQANTGMGMMLKTVMWAKENGKQYVYLGSFQRPTDTYKLQFSGLEWFGGNLWNDDLSKLKSILNT